MFLEGFAEWENSLLLGEHSILLLLLLFIIQTFAGSAVQPFGSLSISNKLLVRKWKEIGPLLDFPCEQGPVRGGLKNRELGNCLLENSSS